MVSVGIGSLDLSLYRMDYLASVRLDAELDQMKLDLNMELSVWLIQTLRFHGCLTPQKEAIVCIAVTQFKRTHRLFYSASRSPKVHGHRLGKDYRT